MTNPIASDRSKFCSCLAVGMLQLGCYVGLEAYLGKKAVAAEDIILNYGVLEFSVSVDSLETYAKTGKISSELKSYTDFLTPEQLAQFKVGLTSSADFSHLAIAQFLYSYQGEKILERMSRVFKTKGRQPGFYAIRSALILAAADQDEGLTPLNVLKKFPTDALRVDSRQGFEIFKDLSKVVQNNALSVAAVEQQVIQESQDVTSFAPQERNLNLLNSGAYTYRQQKLTIRDRVEIALSP